MGVAPRSAIERITNMSTEILNALEASNHAFAAFKANMESRLDGLERNEAKSNRPRIGGDNNPSLRDDPEVKSFVRYLRTGQIESKAMAEGTNGGADGGYAVPKQIANAIESLLLKWSPIRQYARVDTTSTSNYNALVNLRGLGASWVAETAARSATTSPQFANIAFPAGEMYANVQATQWLVDDSFFDLSAWLTDQIAQQFASAENDAFLSGSGTNQPIGLLTVTTAATADGTRPFATFEHVPSGVSGNFAASNPQDQLATLMTKLRPAYRSDAVWLMSPAVRAIVSTWKASTSGVYVFQQPTGPGMPATIFGYPIVEAEGMPAVGANALAIAFCNLKRCYGIVDHVVGTQIIRDPFSNKPYLGYYARKRTSGAPLNSEACKFLKLSVS